MQVYQPRIPLRYFQIDPAGSRHELVKHDIVTAVIYCYITTDFHYAKCDSRLSAYGGVMLQRVYSSSSSKFLKSPAIGSSDLIYNYWKSNETTYKSYNNIMMKKTNSNK